jgi:hypothetical protein
MAFDLPWLRVVDENGVTRLPTRHYAADELDLIDAE